MRKFRLFGAAFGLAAAAFAFTMLKDPPKSASPPTRPRRSGRSTSRSQPASRLVSTTPTDGLGGKGARAHQLRGRHLSCEGAVWRRPDCSYRAGAHPRKGAIR